ncbi:hypothetical protein D770_04870 [Flammeovirgaceae bacterium 311]|nr:hypothetical protein D770_04870 [Flammeovirgaceae bacterium 311]
MQSRKELNIMSGIKESITKLSVALGISSKEFKPVGIHEWPLIMKKIERAFVVKENSNTRFNWWWENLKGVPYQIHFKKDDAYKCLYKLVDDNENIWFIISDSDHNLSKFWLFQGYIGPIQTLIEEHYAFEYYLVSKKYEWLLCENRHGTLIGIGTMVVKMQALLSK